MCTTLLQPGNCWASMLLWYLHIKFGIYHCSLLNLVLMECLQYEIGHRLRVVSDSVLMQNSASLSITREELTLIFTRVSTVRAKIMGISGSHYICDASLSQASASTSAPATATSVFQNSRSFIISIVMNYSHSRMALSFYRPFGAVCDR
jgi:hypothetical protein